MTNGQWIELAAAVCKHAGIKPVSIEVVRTWEKTQNTVYRLDGRRYLKLYHHNATRQFAVERCALRTLEAGGIPAPRLIAAADAAGLATYICTTEVSGSSAEDSWESLSRAEQLLVARDFGAVTAAFHGLPQDHLAEVERNVGGGRESLSVERGYRLAEFEAASSLPENRRTLYAQLPMKRDDLIDFVNIEAHDYVDVPPKFCHCDLSHAHFYVSQASRVWKLSGVIDWAEAMLGPPEWDITFLWLWTFSGDHEAMKECLHAYFAGAPPPQRFARRCFAAVLHNVFWVETWSMLRDKFAREHPESGSLARQMTAFLFPPDVFGPPD